MECLGGMNLQSFLNNWSLCLPVQRRVPQLVYNIVESESDPLTRRAVDLFEKEPLKGNSEVHLHTPTKFGEDRSKDLGGDREQTDRQTNRQTDKRCSIYSMIYMGNMHPCSK